MKFLDSIQRGMAGLNKGIAGGIPRFDKVVYNTQPGKMYSIVGSPKSGKTYFLLYRFILIPWVNGHKLDTFFFSLEVDVEQIKARMVSFFMFYKHKIRLPYDQILGFGESRLSQDNYEKVKNIVENDLAELLKHVTIIVDRGKTNPTGIYNEITRYAQNVGELAYEPYQTFEDGQPVKRNKLVGYTPTDPSRKIVVLVDGLGLMKRERGFTKKQNIDKWMEDYSIILRNIYGFTIVNVHHLNRNISRADRYNMSKNRLQPIAEDIKDTSSIAECSDMVIGIFNPNIYDQIDDHFGFQLRDWRSMYRSIHVLVSRFTQMPVHSALIFDYKSGAWTELPADPKSQEVINLRKKVELL